MRRADSRAGAALTSSQELAAESGAKGMMPFGRPFLDYVISALADAGLRIVTLVVAPDAEDVRTYYQRVAPPTRVELRFAVQSEPVGTADAVLAARHSTEDEPFLVLNSDNYYPVDAYRRLAALGGPGLVAFDAETLIAASGVEAERVLRYALLDIDDDGVLRDVREKPPANDPLAQRSDRWVSMNLWSFTPSIFEACAQVHPSKRGELELVDAVGIAISAMGQRFQALKMHAGVLDLSSRADVGFVGEQLAGMVPRT